MIEQTLKGRYTLTAELGKGAMGTVYRATDAQTGETVALKMLNPDLAPDPQMLERFRREGEALRQLKHPNIVGFVDMFEHGRQLAIVMEYVPGDSLHALIRKDGALPVARARQIALDLCDALIRAHRLGIIHRDLKPENILLAEDGSPKLTDFGVAHLTSENNRLTATGTQVGTPYYMSPEAWEGQPLDAQADVWSLGVVLFEMLTGQLPFGGSTAAAVMTKVLMTPAPDLRQLRPEVPSGLAQVVAGMLARDRALRYQTVREASVDLERGAPQKRTLATPQKAAPPAAPAQTLPQSRLARHPAPRWLGWTAGLAALGVVIALGLVTARPLLSAAARPSAPPPPTAPTAAPSPTSAPALDPPASSTTTLPKATPTIHSTVASTAMLPLTPVPATLPSATLALTALPSATPGLTVAPTLTASTALTTSSSTGPTGRIAFVSDRDGKGQEVYIINADGTGLVQLTDTTGKKAGGISWRPDGTGLTFSWAGSLYNLSLTPHSTPIAFIYGPPNDTYKGSNNLYGSPSWSPDSKRLAYFYGCRDVGCDGSTMGIYLWDQGSRQLMSSNNSWGVSQPNWSSDGRRILYRFETGLYSLEVDTGTRQKLGTVTSFTPSAWSPDGTRLVGFAGLPGRKGSLIFLADASGANAVQLDMPGNNTGPAWSPDGQYLVFCSDRDGNNEIYIMKADGTGQTNLTRNAADDCPDQSSGPAWGP